MVEYVKVYGCNGLDVQLFYIFGDVRVGSSVVRMVFLQWAAKYPAYLKLQFQH